MFSRRLKLGYFTLEGLNSFATVHYCYYFYFYMEETFGFGNRANLIVAALTGVVYAVMAWWGGRFAQRFGYFTALKLGFSTMLVALMVAACCQTASMQIAMMLLTITGMSFTWPSLEAVVSEGEPPAGVQHNVGIYNITWAGTGAVAYFIGGAVLQRFGFKSLFYVPIASFAIQLALTLWLESLARRSPAPNAAVARPNSGPSSGAETAAKQAAATRVLKGRRFLRMAWLANPFAYIAVNTLVAVMPGIAHRLELSTTSAGFCASVWCFARLGAFVGLWLWPGWHYRFRWLLSAYVTLVVTFALILMVPNVAVLILAQLFFGVAIGLIYYSSLFYSMDVGDTKGEHGGIHEAAIGLGNFAGPAVGAASLYFLPQYANSGALAVSGLLLLGLGGLLGIWRWVR